MSRIPEADRERAQAVVDDLLDKLAQVAAQLPYDAEAAIDFVLKDGAE